MEKADRQFENMRIVARERLLRHTPQEVSRKAGVRYEDGMYLVDTLGKTVSVRLPDCTVLPQLSNWHTLTLLHYLDLADGAPPSGCMISFSQYKDGLVRGGGLDRNAELIVRRDLGVRMRISVRTFRFCRAAASGLRSGLRTTSCRRPGGC